MELHLVHFNDKYADIATAVTKSDGLAVLGIFFVISHNDNPALAPIVAAIQKIKKYGGWFILRIFPLYKYPLMKFETF